MVAVTAGVMMWGTLAAGTLPDRVRLADPRFDDQGPGDYIYPTGPWYRPGMYDLLGFDVEPRANDVVFRVWVNFPVEEPDQVLINSNQALPLDNEIYFRNIDIYVDHTVGHGHTDGIPGRNVRFRDEEAWDFAIVITPQPDLVRQILRGWPPARDIYVADNVRSRGREIWVTVPYARIGGLPDPTSGYQVTISGALERNNFQVFQRVTDAFQVDALTMPVFGVAETQAFGGGDLSRWQPRTIDIFTPPGVTQREVLAHYDHDTRDFAVLPMIYPAGARSVARAREPGRLRPFAVEPAEDASTLDLQPGPQTSSSTSAAGSATSRPPAAPEDDGFVYTTVRDVYEQMAILEARPGAIEPYRVGTVVGSEGQELGRVVVTAIYPDFIQATIVQGQEEISAGDRVRFDPKRSTPQSEPEKE